MSIALKGLLTGVFQGIGEAMDEERKQTKELLATRTKNAYQNYLRYQEQSEALKSEIKKRDALARQYQPDLNDEERIAVASMPNALELYQKALQEDRRVEGRVITLRDIVKVGDKVKGMTYDDFVKNLAQVKPVESVSVQAPRSFIGVPEDAQRQYMSRLSAGVGVAPEQLMAFEQPPEAPSVEPMGSVRPDVAFSPVFNTLEEKAQRLMVLLGETEDEDTKTRIQEQIDQTREAMLGHALATSTKKGDEPKAVATITSSVDRAVRERLETKYGRNIFSEEKVIDLGNGQTYVTRGIRTDVSPEVEQQIMADRRKFAFDALKNNGYLDEDNQPVYQNVNEVMYNLGLRGGLPQRVDVAPPGSAAPAAGRAVTTTPQRGVVVQAPNGATYTFPTQEAADAFKKAAGIK
jgi:hypothetical protein